MRLAKELDKDLTTDFLLPYSGDLTVDLPVSILGYPTKQKISNWVVEMYPDKKRLQISRICFIGILSLSALLHN